MIVVSIVLVLTAVGLFLAGLALAADSLYYSSIVVSVLAAFALVVGARRMSTVVEPTPGFDDSPPGGHSGGSVGGSRSGTGRGGGSRTMTRTMGRASVPSRPAVAPAVPVHRGESAAEPTDEPAAQQLSAAQAARLTRVTTEVITTEVMVVDGRPRYHLRDCLHLLGRPGERLSAAEAIASGFTACGQCQPATALLAAVGQDPFDTSADPVSGPPHGAPPHGFRGV